MRAALLILTCLAPQEADLPLLLSEDFEKGADRWEPMEPGNWKILEAGGGKVYSHFVRKGEYKPPHRSPVNIALLKDIVVGDFVLEARLQSTVEDYGHRDMCLVFGYQDAAHFYYSHLGKKADNNANQLFIVNDKPRTKISTKTTEGTNWTNGWHRVKLVRKVSEGTIEVYWDDMKTPVQTATDKTFAWGRIGIGSFDDTGNWDDIKLCGRRVEPEKKQ